jgi:predicted nucleotidyltransferase
MEVALDKDAVLSVQVPESLRDRIAAIASQRGTTLDDLVGGLIERFLGEAERRPPELAVILATLRSLEGPLRACGVASMFVFGSVARGDAGPDSDVDLAFDFSADATPSLFDIGRIRETVEQALGRPVDIGERAAMKPRIAAMTAGTLVRAF